MVLWPNESTRNEPGINQLKHGLPERRMHLPTQSYAQNYAKLSLGGCRVLLGGNKLPIGLRKQKGRHMFEQFAR